MLLKDPIVMWVNEAKVSDHCKEVKACIVHRSD